MELKDVLANLDALAEPQKVNFKREKFGVSARNALGIYHKDLKVLAKQLGKNHELACQLYDTGVYEARLLCSKIADPHQITTDQMDRWAMEFENWEVCDSFCMGLFIQSPLALEKAMAWSFRRETFVKRAAFAIMAAYGMAHKKADNEVFESFFEPILREAHDDRLYVKKAIDWALRSIGKRNQDLRKSALEVAQTLKTQPAKSAQWIGKTTEKELAGSKVNILDYPRHIYRK